MSQFAFIRFSASLMDKERNIGQYCVAKVGVEMLVRNAADELGRYGIPVNGVRPGLVPTEIAKTTSHNG